MELEYRKFLCAQVTMHSANFTCLSLSTIDANCNLILELPLRINNAIYMIICRESAKK